MNKEREKEQAAAWMRRAIDEAVKGMRKGEGGPFGACIVKDGELIAAAHNTVLKNQDATCHAEVNAVRKACKKLGTFDLSGCAIYSTTEPCPMCFSAIHWARIGTLFYGTAIRDVKSRGFHELNISNRQMARLGQTRIMIIERFMREECLALLKEWDAKAEKETY